MLYADIIVNISHENLDKTYEYAIPEEWEQEAVIGAQVHIPFGAGNRLLKGFIVGLSDIPKYEPAKIKAIHEVIKNGVIVESHFIRLAYWIKENYGATMNDALRTVLPIKQTVKRQEKKYIQLAVEKEEAEKALELFIRKKYKARVRLLEELLKEGMLEFDTAIHRLNISRAVIKAFEEKGLLTILTEQRNRNPIKERVQEAYHIRLNEKQREIAEAIIWDYQNGIRKTYLLHGITGSGKTEVYMEVISKVIEAGGQVIFLIPEIALTYQTVMRFYRRFGNRISILHSRLSGGERYDQYLRAKNGEIDIMIGPRSALFTPFQNLGLILIDEEHENSYKSEAPPKYHAREVAIERARMLQASVILGSATPSLESYYKAKTGEYQLFTLTNRAGSGRLPTIWVADLREELKRKNKSIFSTKLRELMEDRLQQKQQIMLFINRRGYAGFISCRSCGHVMKCPHCDVSLTAHTNGKLVCHYCGYEEGRPMVCPSCQSKYIAAFGTGTQKVEEYVKKEFPQARVLRMDTDTTGGKEGHEKILAAFSNHEADILVGTQMIVKGHDFPEVTLVGVIAADLSLYANDYRAAERTFQLLAQAAGRAGRGEKKGEVVIQSYNTEHYSVEAAAKHNYEEFYEQELAFRTLLNYPPVGHMLAILISSKQEERAEWSSQLLAGAIREKAPKILVIGPAKASLSKAKDIYRRMVYIKDRDYSQLKELKDYLEGYMDYSEQFKGVTIQFDFDPVTGY